MTDPLGQTTRYAYDRLNRLTQVQDAQGGTASFTYDPNGNLLTVTDAAGRQTTYAYNPMDRLETRTDPLTHAETYQYDANGNLTQVTDRKSQVTTFTYDGLDRRTVTTYPGAVTVTATYNAGHRVTQLVDTAAGTITRASDGLDRPGAVLPSGGEPVHQRRSHRIPRRCCQPLRLRSEPADRVHRSARSLGSESAALPNHHQTRRCGAARLPSARIRMAG